MANQAPMISIPKKTTEEVDWTSPIRTLIAQSYGENPDNYAAECASLQRCRQDAVRGAGSDMTARDLLYKYFGQLELLELRFSEIRVNFPWHDAFTHKLTTQTSIAYEKASILFQIAATHSAIASSQSRADPEGVKRAYHYFRTCAGMLTYINENFLHAPSTDLSREVVKFLVNLILAQATEVFFDKCADEKKAPALVAKIAAQTAAMYTSLAEEVKEFMGKGIFDRNWVTLVQIKAKHFSSLAQLYRAQVDAAADKHGDALVRLQVAENLAKDALRTATSFASAFVPNLSPTLPADAGPAIQERTKAHLALCTERRSEAQRENDLIYNAILPAPEALPVLDKLTVATPIPIQEVYGTPDVQKTIGQDFFIRLIPLSVHESASVYSEEKAKLARGEVEKADQAEGEARSALDGMGVKEGLTRFRAMAEGEVGGADEVPLDVRRWRDDITVIEEREGVEAVLAQLSRLKEGVQRELDSAARDLEIESKDCEMLRVKYDHKWTQAPSAGLSKPLRQDLKAHTGALEAAAASDAQVLALWHAVQGDIRLLMSPQLEDVFRASTERDGGDNLLDLDVSGEADEAQERAKIGEMVAAIDERLGKLNKISRERNEVLKDLKEKIQTDDVSHLLLLNRRNTGVEPTLFATELEKFKPYQQRLAATVQYQTVALKEVAALWKSLRESAGRGPGARKWEEREKKKKDTVRRFQRARDGYMEIRDGLAKGLQFYNDLTELATKLRSNVKLFVNDRVRERDSLVAAIETENRLSGAPMSPPPLSAKPPVPPPPPTSSLESSLASMNLRSAPSPHQSSPAPQWQNTPPPPPHLQQHYSYGSQQYAGAAPSTHTSYAPSPPPPPPSQYPPPSQSQPSYPPPHQRQGSTSTWLPPPPAPSAPPSDPYAGLGMFGDASRPTPPPSQPQYTSLPPSQQQPYASPPPPPPSQPYGSYAQPQQQYAYQQQQQQPGFPPPPPPASTYQQYGTPPPQPGQQGYAPQGYGGYSYGR
ncbi:BRO1-like domain-containing protein [Schizophyllum amplum]|uniref:BRO domain-containing protein 1 n=1 Tax=Schizophyllum amplum TaxID=97359 RepID=A0A550CQM7_9AGAR|nr:BRO1-like domain-containing protein [Auriculariopsis ampla]